MAFNFTGASTPPRHQLEESLTIFFYSTAVLLSTLGNVTAVAVFALGRQSRTELRGFLISLAVADLLIGCFCLPFTLVNVYNKSWPLPHLLCKLVCYFQLVAVTSSVFTNMVIGFDRFWVVAYPLSHRLTYNRSRPVICALWLLSLMLSSVQLLVSGKQKVNGTDQCKEHWESERNQRIYSVFVLALTYLLPLAVLSATYAAIGRKLWQRTMPGNADSARDSNHIRAKRKIVKMLIVVVLLFAICWMPLHVYNVLADYTQLNTWLSGEALERVFITSHWTAMANCFVNPLVYGFMNDSFKDDLSNLLNSVCCCCSGGGRRGAREIGGPKTAGGNSRHICDSYRQHQHHDGNGFGGKSCTAATPRPMSSRIDCYSPKNALAEAGTSLDSGGLPTTFVPLLRYGDGGRGGGGSEDCEEEEAATTATSQGFVVSRQFVTQL